MADEAAELEEGEGGGRGNLIKIIGLVVGILLLVALTIGGTLFLSGFFEADEEATAEAAVAALEAIASEEAAAAAAALAGPDRVTMDSPELTRYEQTYFEIESEMTSNLSNSRKVMQVKVYIMTHYDERVLAHMEKHDFPIRSALMRIMANKTEQDLARPTFREELAEEFKIEINSLLEALTDFGGVEKVGFTAFVVQ
jgi:flagellar FliL protein